MDEAHYEHAARLEEAERQAALAAATRAMSAAGQADCEDCGEPIPASRRAALPSAIRCFWCQSEHEQQRSRLFPSADR